MEALKGLYFQVSGKETVVCSKLNIKWCIYTLLLFCTFYFFVDRQGVINFVLH